MPHLMKSGDINALAFIGGSRAADDLIRQHPQPHRLKVFLQLEAKNMGVRSFCFGDLCVCSVCLWFEALDSFFCNPSRCANQFFPPFSFLQIFLPDLFAPGKESELSKALDQAMLGALSFNGQRCTALKIFHVPVANDGSSSYADSFAKAIADRVEQIPVGLPWEIHGGKDGTSTSTSYSSITPLPGMKRIEYMRELIEDAVSKGAMIMNKDGGTIIGGPESTLMIPAVLYPVKPGMKIYTEEQFGPIVPIATYESLDTVIGLARDGIYGQQVSIFLSDEDSAVATDLLDKFSSIFGKININTQCGRSPDTLPFSGRRSSAMGVMSVKDALKEFSIPTVLSSSDNPINRGILESMESTSKFLEPM